MNQPIIHPGEILAEEFLKPAGVTRDKLADDLKLPSGYLDDILTGKRSVGVDAALRLSRYFGTSDRFWLEAQMAYDLGRAGPCKAAIRREVPSPARGGNGAF